MSEEKIDNGHRVVVDTVHEYCPLTGFCTKCGSHMEYIKYEDLFCTYATNGIGLSHRRALQIMERASAGAHDAVPC